MKPNKIVFIILINFIFVLGVNAQNVQTFYGEKLLIDDICKKIMNPLGFKETKARELLNKITTTCSMPISPYRLKACSGLDNAVAIILDEKQYIAYDPEFIEKIENGDETDWTKMAILAHEVGHHILGHTLNPIDQVDIIKQRELEADQFSGSVLCKLGATLEQAQVAAKSASTEGHCEYCSHPSKEARMDAIGKGFLKENCNSSPVPMEAPDLSQALIWFKDDTQHNEMFDLYQKNEVYLKNEPIHSYQYAKLYNEGKGTMENEEAAFKWMQISAVKGHIEAQNQLGNFYGRGQGVEKDYQEAAKWYKRAAKANHAMAQRNFGFMYEKGYGVEQSYLKAIEWYEKSATQGNDRAQLSLGNMYETGRGVEVDMNKAKHWYTLAAEKGNSLAQGNLGYILENSSLHKQAIHWYKKASQQGNSRATKNLAYLYEKGKGTQKNYKEAYRLYKILAHKDNDTFSQCRLGWLIEQGGFGLKQNYDKAMAWYKKAAKEGNTDAETNLGYLYEKGLGISVNYFEATKWYKKAAEKGNDRAQNNIGRLYLNGLGVQENRQEAIRWFKLAAQQNNSIAKKNLKNLGVAY